jgi:hypothetical protein
MSRGLPTRLCGILLVTAGLAIAAPSTAGAVETVLSVPAYKQEKSNWCWAAAVQMIVKYKAGVTVSQCQAVKNGKNSSSCGNVTGTFGDANRALYAGGVNYGTQRVLDWDTVRAEMNTSRPIYSRIAWRSGGGHAHVIRGYYDTGYSYGVSYIDPSSGTSTSREWGNYRSNSDWTADAGLIYLTKR